MQIDNQTFKKLFGPTLEKVGPAFYNYAQGLREEGQGLQSDAIEEWIGEFLVDLDDYQVDLIKPMIDDIIDNVIFEDHFNIIC